MRSRRLGEETLHVRRPGPGIDRVQQFLVREFLSGDVDRLEPLQLLVVATLAEIDRQPVVENPVLLPCREVGEIAEEVVELSRDIFADGQRALLAVHHLKCAVATNRPVHDVERIAFRHRVYHCFLLRVRVDELALILRAHVEFATERHDALFVVVPVTRDQVADCYLVRFNLHFFLLMMMRE